MVSVWPVVPSSTSWWATRPRSRTECTRIPPAPSPPRAPSATVFVVGSGAQSADAAAMRSAVCIAVPDGASIFWSWCSSMISAVSKYGAASSAKRIISTAPIAKFGAITAFALDASNAVAELVEVVVGEPGGADDRVDAVLGAPREVLAGGVDHGEVDRDLGAGVGAAPRRCARPACRARRSRAAAGRCPRGSGSTAATSSSSGSPAPPGTPWRPCARRRRTPRP